MNRKTGGEGAADAAAGSRAADDEEGQAPDSLARRIWDQVAPVAVAVGIALLIRATVIESYYVPSESMLPENPVAVANPSGGSTPEGSVGKRTAVAAVTEISTVGAAL